MYITGAATAVERTRSQPRRTSVSQASRRRRDGSSARSLVVAFQVQKRAREGATNMMTIDLDTLSLVRGGDGGTQTPQDICGPGNVKNATNANGGMDIPSQIPNIDLGPLHVNNGKLSFGFQHV